MIKTKSTFWIIITIMLPQIQLCNIVIPTYTLLIAIAFFIGSIVASKISNRFLVDESTSFIALCVAEIGVIIGGKVLYLLVNFKHLSQILQNQGLFALCYKTGFVFYGALIGAIFAIYVFCKIHKSSFFNTLSLLITITPLIQAIGRIGCFCAGCCYGIPWDGFGAIFIAGEYRFPIQLLSSFLDGILFFVLLLISASSKIRRFEIPIYFILYAIIRIICEQFRGDIQRGFLGHLSISTIISITLFLSGLYILVTICKKT